MLILPIVYYVIKLPPEWEKKILPTFTLRLGLGFPRHHANEIFVHGFRVYMAQESQIRYMI